jgi:hypothetical protein
MTAALMNILLILYQTKILWYFPAPSVLDRFEKKELSYNMKIFVPSEQQQKIFCIRGVSLNRGVYNN